MPILPECVNPLNNFLLVISLFREFQVVCHELGVSGMFLDAWEGLPTEGNEDSRAQKGPGYLARGWK